MQKKEEPSHYNKEFRILMAWSLLLIITVAPMEKEKEIMAPQEQDLIMVSRI